VDLKFVETYFTNDGARLFDVVANGVTVTSTLDLWLD